MGEEPFKNRFVGLGLVVSLLGRCDIFMFVAREQMKYLNINMALSILWVNLYGFYMFCSTERYP